jgi:virginiamycin B lyase
MSAKDYAVRRCAPALLVAVSLTAAAAGYAYATSPAAPVCRSGSVPAVIGGHNVCLRSGQRCLRRFARQYRRSGFTCAKGKLRRSVKPTPSPRPTTPPALVGAVKIAVPSGRPALLAASESALWIAVHNGGTVFRLDPQTNSIVSQVGPANNRVCGLDASSPGALWLANCGPRGAAEGGIVRIATETKVVAATIPVAESLDVAVGEGAVWALADAGNEVWRIDPASNTVVAKIPVGPLPAQLTVADGSVWVTDIGNGTLSRIDPATNRVTATISVGESNGSSPDSAAGVESIVAGGGAVWVGNDLDNKLYKIDPSTNVVTALDIGAADRGNWRAMSLAYGAGSVWALADACNIARIDPTSGAVTKRYTICDPATASGTGGIALAFGSLWVTFPEDGILWRIQP